MQQSINQPINELTNQIVFVWRKSIVSYIIASHDGVTFDYSNTMTIIVTVIINTMSITITIMILTQN